MSEKSKFAVIGLCGGERVVKFVSVSVTDEQVANGQHYRVAMKKSEVIGFLPLLALSENDPAYISLREAKVLIHVNKGCAEHYCDSHIEVVTYDDDNPPEDREPIPESFKELMQQANITDYVFEVAA